MSIVDFDQSAPSRIIGSMNKQFLRSLSTALLTTAFGTAIAVFGSSVKAMALNSPNLRSASQPLPEATTSDSTPSVQPAVEGDDLQTIKEIQPLLGGSKPIKPQAASMVKGQGGAGGMASWYGPGFHGRRTANGEVYNQNALTAAHRSLPFGTKVRVTNVNTGSSVIVRINDRGPFAGGRVIDLSAAAARVIGMIRSGVAPVRIEILGR